MSVAKKSSKYFEKHNRNASGQRARQVPHLQGDVLPEGDVPGHSEMVQLQHVGDVLEPGQKLLDLQNRGKEPNQKDHLLVSGHITDHLLGSLFI